MDFDEDDILSQIALNKIKKGQKKNIKTHAQNKNYAAAWFYDCTFFIIEIQFDIIFEVTNTIIIYDEYI